jgi:hypothetical protein
VTDLLLKRLMPEDPTAWGYWPVLEARVRAALPALEPEANPDHVLQHFRTLWATQPARLGAWLALRPVERTNGHTPLPEVIGHLLAYVDVYWGEPCLFVYQMEGTAGAGCLHLLAPMLRELDHWKDALNIRFAEAVGGKRIDLVRFYTQRPDAFERWFRERVDVKLGGTIISFRLSEVTMPSVEA